MPRGFFAKIAILILPFAMMFVLMWDISLKQGEANPPFLILTQQRTNHDLLYLPNWSREDRFFYKFKAVTTLNPDVLILGSSRMYHWRTNYMFTGNTSSYNAAIGSLEPIEAQWFVEALIQSNTIPDVIILSIDDPFFNADAVSIRESRVASVAPPFNYAYQYTFSAIRATSRRYVLSPNRLLNFYQSYEASNYIGTVARDSTSGFRYDGSRYIANIDEFRIRQLERQEMIYVNQEDIFARGNSVYEESIIALENILILATEQDMMIVGLLPSYNNSHFERMMTSGEFSYLPQARERIQALFTEYEMPLFDFTNPETLGGSDEELYDYWHSGDVLALRQYHTILTMRPDIFAPYSDTEQIASVLAQVEHPLYLP